MQNWLLVCMLGFLLCKRDSRAAIQRKKENFYLTDEVLPLIMEPNFVNFTFSVMLRRGFVNTQSEVCEVVNGVILWHFS